MRRVHYRAAGGVVVQNGKVLLLNRPSRNEVRLPKGHVEEGESAAAAALREVREESGYAHLSILAGLGTQHVHFYDPYRERQVTRDEHYFLMVLRDETTIARSKKEHQFDPAWVRFAEAIARLSFESEKEFVRRAQRWIQENGLPGGR